MYTLDVLVFLNIIVKYIWYLLKYVHSFVHSAVQQNLDGINTESQRLTVYEKVGIILLNTINQNVNFVVRMLLNLNTV